MKDESAMIYTALTIRINYDVVERLAFMDSHIH